MSSSNDSTSTTPGSGRGRSRRIGTRVLRWLLVVLVVGGLAGAIALAMQPTPVAVDLVVAARGPMQVTVDEEGRTRIREPYVISTPLQGRSSRIALDPGDPVIAGHTIIATIDPREPALLDARARAAAEARVRAAAAAMQQAGAALGQAAAAADFAENELARVRAAESAGATMPREVDAAETELRDRREAYRAARFAEEIARFELQQAEAALAFSGGEDAPAGAAGAGAGAGASGASGEDRFVIRSPITGSVLRVLQRSSAVLEPGAPLVEVGDPSDLEVVIDVLSADAVAIRPGASVAIDAWGGPEPLEAVVRTVEPSAFTELSALGVEEQRVNIVADFRSPPQERPTLGDGYRVEARILVWESPEVLQVPAGAVFRPLGAAGTDRWAVFTVEDGRARRREVTIGRRSWRTVQITGGLEPGEPVVLHPSDRLAEGVRVEVRPGD